MRKKNYKGRSEKRVLSKCIGVCRTYDALQYAYKDGYLCEFCFYEDFVICEDCGTLIRIEDSKVINPHLENKKYVCSNCVNKYHRCSHCESLVSSDEVWASDSDVVICNYCDEFYYICDSCRCIVHEDNVYYEDGEN